MRKTNENIIIQITAGSIAEEMGIEPGDILLKVNNKTIHDVFDYRYLIKDEYIELSILKSNEEEWILEIEKDPEEDIGIIFDSGLMDEVKSCRNKCIFCFIDQLPPNMRETLYFKDDDSRLSFLQGNYITLTNMSDADLDRIIYYHLSPINISVHTTNMELRKKMLCNRFAGNILDRIKKLVNARILMNGQIVLCKDVNDGEELDRTIEELSAFIPYMQSVSVVPVGLSKFRKGLYPLEPFTKSDSQKVVQQIQYWQEKIYQKHQIHFIHGADEFYLSSRTPVPTYNSYDGFPQLENGVGMIRLMENEFTEYINQMQGDPERHGEVSIVTGKLAEDFITSLVQRVQKKYPNIIIHIYPIENHYFGERITVVGLLTGQDIIHQLEGKPLGDKLLLPKNLLKVDEPILLDNITVNDIESTLQTVVHIVESTGSAFVDAIINTKENFNE